MKFLETIDHYHVYI